MQPLSDNRGPLEGVTVLDFTTALSGPLCTYFLGSMGATVIKIEPPQGGDAVRSYAPFLGGNGLSMTQDGEEAMSLAILNRGRGKRCVSLDLKSDGGLDVYAKLVRKADVVVENYSAGTADRLGIGYAQTRAINPDIIYCAISGFGADVAPGRKAMDALIQAMSGVMMTSGEDGAPPVRVGIPVADIAAPLFAAMGVNAALYRRQMTGQGEFVDVSMLGALTSLVAVEDWQAMAKLNFPFRTGNTLARLSPFGTYRCRDGFISIIAGGREKMAHALFAAMGCSELAEDPRFATVAARSNRDSEITRLIETWTADLDVSDVEERLNAAGVVNARVSGPEEAVENDIVNQRAEVLNVVHPTLGQIDGLKTSGIPIHFSSHPAGASGAARKIGQDNELVFREWLQMSEAEYKALHRTGVFGQIS